MGTSITNKKISKSTLINLILASVLIVVLIFGYFYWKKTSPVEVIKSNATVTAPSFEYSFAIYGGDRQLNDPYEVLAFNSSVFVSDSNNRRIAVFDPTGKYVRDISTKDMRSPSGMFWDGSRLYVADPDANKVFIFNPNGTLIDSIKLDPKILVVDIAVDGNFMYLLNNRAQQVDKFDLNLKKVIKSFGGYGNGDGQLFYPYDLTVRDGSLYVADSMNNRINVYDLEGKFIKALPKLSTDKKKGKLYVPRGIAFDKAGNLYTVEGMAHKVTGLNPNGEVLLEITKSETVGDEPQDIYLPTDVTFDEIGRLYVLEHAYKRVLVYKQK